MSDTNPTRRADEPPTRDGAPLAGWPTVITAEEAVALREALGQLQTALDAVVRDRDEARAEVERLREALREALDGLRYWVPQTIAGAVEKCRIVEKGIEALEVKSAVERCRFMEAKP
jgi:hypothetical protein